jgi:hypothetical protein
VMLGSSSTTSTRVEPSITSGDERPIRVASQVSL